MPDPKGYPPRPKPNPDWPGRGVNPEVGARCGECRLGLGTHNTDDPLCEAGRVNENVLPDPKGYPPRPKPNPDWPGRDPKKPPITPRPAPKPPKK